MEIMSIYVKPCCEICKLMSTWITPCVNNLIENAFLQLYHERLMFYCKGDFIDGLSVDQLKKAREIATKERELFSFGDL